jgi:hypothetical protein
VDGIEDVIDAMNPLELAFTLEKKGVSNREELNNSYFDISGIQSLAKALKITINIHSVSKNNIFDSSCMNPSTGNIVHVVYTNSGKFGHNDSLHSGDCDCGRCE